MAVYFFIVLVVDMDFGTELEMVRKAKGIGLNFVMDALNIFSEKEYDNIIHNRRPLTVYQYIMLVDLLRHSFENMPHIQN